jgi:DNA-binding NtrC family response regulator
MAGVTAETLRVLRSARWRGNVRELDNVLQRAVILGEGPWIEPADLPPDLLLSSQGDPESVDDLGEAIRRFERRHIERVLASSSDKREAARRLGMGLSSLYRKIGELGLGQPSTDERRS